MLFFIEPERKVLCRICTGGKVFSMEYINNGTKVKDIQVAYISGRLKRLGMDLHDGSCNGGKHQRDNQAL